MSTLLFLDLPASVVHMRKFSQKRKYHVSIEKIDVSSFALRVVFFVIIYLILEKRFERERTGEEEAQVLNLRTFDKEEARGKFR